MPLSPNLTDYNFFRKTALIRFSVNALREATPLFYAILPTIRHITQAGGRVVLLGHYGDPKGKPDSALSLQPLTALLSEHLNQNVTFTPDCIGRSTEQAIADTPYGQTLLLENVDFHLSNQTNDPQFSQELADLADVYIFAALNTLTQSSASTNGLIPLLPSYLSLCAQQERANIQDFFNTPQKPRLAIIGGTQIATKLKALQHLISSVDMLMLSGGIATTFLEAKDHHMGRSFIEPEYIEAARDILTEAGILGCRILLPQDLVTTTHLSADPSTHHIKKTHDLTENDIALDMGPQTIKTWSKVAQDAAAILWYGTLSCTDNPSPNSANITLAQNLKNKPALIAGQTLSRQLAPFLNSEGNTQFKPALSDDAMTQLLCQPEIPLFA